MMLASVLGLFVTEVIWEQKFEVTRLKVVADLERRLQHIKTGGVEAMQRAARDARELQEQEERDTTTALSANNNVSRMSTETSRMSLSRTSTGSSGGRSSVASNTAFSTTGSPRTSTARAKRASINSHMGTSPKINEQQALHRQNTKSFQEQQFVSGVDRATVRTGKSPKNSMLREQENRSQEDIDYENAQVLAFC